MRVRARGVPMLPLLAVLPSCTISLWGDHRTRDVTEIADPPDLCAFLERGDAPSHVLTLPDSVATRLHEHLPSIPADARWLRLRPQHDAHSLDLANNASVWVLQQPDEPPVIALGAWRRPRKWGPTQPWPEPTICTHEVLATPVAPSGGTLLSCEFSVVNVRDDDPVLVKVALTPPALVADAVGYTVLGVAFVIAGPFLLLERALDD